MTQETFHEKSHELIDRHQATGYCNVRHRDTGETWERVNGKWTKTAPKLPSTPAPLPERVMP